MNKPKTNLVLHVLISTITALAITFLLLSVDVPRGIILILSMMMFAGIFFSLTCKYICAGSQQEIKNIRTSAILFAVISLFLACIMFSLNKTQKTETDEQIFWPENASTPP